MAVDMSFEDPVETETASSVAVDREEVATQLQCVYEHLLHGKRPEAIGATEVLADELDVDIERPERVLGQAPR